MNFDAIEKAIRDRKIIGSTRVFGNVSKGELKLWTKSDISHDLEYQGIHEEAFRKAFGAAESVLNQHLKVLREKLDAEARGIILEARREERPDAHLDEIARLFGPHKGLNANWAVMAWHLGGLVWLTDDENDKTVTLVTRSQTGEDEMHEIASGLTPAKALQVWAMISEEGR